ncbi:integrase, catalytic region, zinc finger, CCHC-type containing protein [Tanacetum coccineum]
METIRFVNDQFAKITGYGDYLLGNVMICHVYYFEGLGHNLFSVDQFCDATSTKSWLWHRRLSHLNFSTINQLSKQNLVDGLSKFKYDKDHLCSACEQGKSKRIHLKPKLVPSADSKLELIHVDLCGPMRLESFNEDFDDLFGLLYEEYYEKRQPEVSINSVAHTTLNNEDTPSSSKIFIDDNEAHQIVSASEEATSPISNDLANESIQEDNTDLDGNTFINPFCSLMTKETESSSTN